MNARMSERTVKRPPLPLTERDLAELNKLRGEPLSWNALWSLARQETPTGEVTESVVIHAIFTVGLRAIHEAAEAASYAADAEDRRGEDAERRSLARRRRPGWAKEE
jgi:hypothetical protein